MTDVEGVLDKNKKLILIDEFEAITEVQAAAKILTNFLIEISKKDNFLISVSHLGKDLQNYLKKNNIKNINQAFIDCDIEVERFISCTFALAAKLLNDNPNVPIKPPPP